MTVIPIVLASLSLLVSVGGLLYRIRTYASSRRPYIGVVDSAFQLVENPPRAIVWKLVLKNVGTIPASVKIEENRATLTTPEGVSPLPSLGAIGDTRTYLMPDQTIDLLGQYTEVGGPIQDAADVGMGSWCSIFMSPCLSYVR